MGRLKMESLLQLNNSERMLEVNSSGKWKITSEGSTEMQGEISRKETHKRVSKFE